MFARTALRSARPVSRRTYATPSEPVNLQRGSSKTPFFVVGALAVLAAGYSFGFTSTPTTPAVKNMKEATHAKTPEAQAAAGQGSDPHARPSVAGGDQKAKQ
ncbi:hypothetical protein BCR35DRAFT_310046 [Leucosporidium creatinivorum]|uniref:Uncharacterized protein n=1 Tax=Leucosporidium creatinivorum TaxID=106004 RepID=A0A1Y2DA57_9BASI|nr:hypothetical protein BCR35DRAFT_310046 [Leucosporidium creatinivorum]